MTYCRQYAILGDETNTYYARYSEDYYDDCLWILEEGNYWLDTVPFVSGEL